MFEEATLLEFFSIRRKPAWTDRILYMASPEMPVVGLQYMSHPEITFSDHRPLSASFVVRVSPASDFSDIRLV
jgi:hypothetical protein